jgi:hypothetical protein
MDFGWPFVFFASVTCLDFSSMVFFKCGLWIPVGIAYTLSAFVMGMERFSLDYYCVLLDRVCRTGFTALSPVRHAVVLLLEWFLSLSR